MREPADPMLRAALQDMIASRPIAMGDGSGIRLPAVFAPFHPEAQYLDLLRDLLQAPPRPDRTGTGTCSIFGRRMEFDLADGFPLLTTKKLPFRVIAIELLWFLSGSTNAKWLEDQGVNIWREWGDPETRQLGPIYGKQWRSWFKGEVTDGSMYVDQIQGVLDSLRTSPYDRGHVVSAWNVADLPKMALRPCHCLFQFYVEDDGRLSCQLYQRSADAFLGLPFNIASYALLTMMFARALGRRPGRFVWTGGDVHLYLNHEDQARLQLTREPREFPNVHLSRRDDLDSWELSDFGLFRYDAHPHIPAPVSK
jgi:thymidylate synthase